MNGIGSDGPLFSFSLFLPTIINELGIVCDILRLLCHLSLSRFQGDSGKLIVGSSLCLGLPCDDLDWVHRRPHWSSCIYQSVRMQSTVLL